MFRSRDTPADGWIKVDQVEPLHKRWLSAVQEVAVMQHQVTVVDSGSLDTEMASTSVSSSWHPQARILSWSEERGAKALDVAGAASPSLRALRASAMSATLTNSAASLSRM
uniref:Uncharacterized protein n=1 Tax=Setaria italica TaxID=4555 RepID=K3XNE9_SETIT